MTDEIDSELFKRLIGKYPEKIGVEEKRMVSANEEARKEFIKRRKKQSKLIP
jgi:hypothetical protein